MRRKFEVIIDTLKVSIDRESSKMPIGLYILYFCLKLLVATILEDFLGVWNIGKGGKLLEIQNIGKFWKNFLNVSSMLSNSYLEWKVPE